MTADQIVKHFHGSVEFTAYNLGYSEAAVRKWVSDKRVPPKPQRLVELITAGKLKADKIVKVKK